MKLLLRTAIVTVLLFSNTTITTISAIAQNLTATNYGKIPVKISESCKVATYWKKSLIEGKTYVITVDLCGNEYGSYLAGTEDADNVVSSLPRLPE